MDKFQIGLHYTIVYFLVVFLSVVFCSFSEMNRKQKKVYLFLVLSLFFIIMALKNADMGNDTFGYINMFHKISRYRNPMVFAEESGVENGYVVYNYVISKMFGGEVRWLFVITAAFICFSVGRYMDKYSSAPGVVCCLFIPLCFNFFLSGMRQAIAVAILLFAYDCIVKKRFVSFLIIWFVAVQFHNTAMIFPIVYFLINFAAKDEKGKKWFNIILWTTTVLCYLFFDRFLVLLLTMFPKYTYYVGSALLDGEPRVAIFLQAVVSIMMLLIPSLIKGKTTADKKIIRTIDEKMSLLNVAMLVISSNATALNRMCPYFRLFTLNQYANDVSELKPQNRTILLLFTIIAFYVYGLIIAVFKTPDWQTTYPIMLQWEL